MSIAKVISLLGNGTNTLPPLSVVVSQLSFKVHRLVTEGRTFPRFIHAHRSHKLTPIWNLRMILGASPGCSTNVGFQASALLS